MLWFPPSASTSGYLPPPEMPGQSLPAQAHDTVFTRVDGSLNVGNTYTTAYDNSKHDNSSHHHGDTYTANSLSYYYGSASSSKLPQDRLEENVSKGAAHDSADRGPDAPKCYPETREAVQEEILSWIDCGGATKLLWLSGPAGAGKTAISGSIADACHARGWLAGSFFLSAFSGGVDRRSKRYVIPTLAYHLMHSNIPGLRAEILTSIEANPSVFDKQLEHQVDVLILGPLRKINHNSESWPKVVIVDGVDECDADQRHFETEHERQRSKGDNHQEILSALIRATNYPSFPFRIVVASRPERAIKAYFDSLPAGGIKEVFLDNKYNPEADIELYNRAMLIKIGREYGLPEDWYAEVVPEDWPEHRSRDVPRYLAAEASGQFVYAATAMRYVQDTLNPPQEQLKRVLFWWHSDSARPFAKLDALYAGILKTSPKPALAAKWICAINAIQDRSPGPKPGRTPFPIWWVRALLESSRGETEYLFGSLSSLVGIVDNNGEAEYRLYHKSLLDFLGDADRGADLHVGFDEYWRFVSARCFETLKGRGPQVQPLREHAKDEFNSRFAQVLPYLIYPSFCRSRCHSSDVSWWIAKHPGRHHEAAILLMFGNMHMWCNALRCLPACKVWRKTLMRFCKDNGWRVPTLMERLLNNFRHVPYGYYSATDSLVAHPRSPLQPPPPSIHPGLARIPLD